MIKRIFIVIAAAILMTLGLAAPSFAHHNTIVGSVNCATEPNTWNVTWNVTNSEARTETITASNRSVVPVGSQLTSRQTKSFTETVHAAATLNLTLSARWTNGVTNTNSGSVSESAFAKNCWQPEPKSEKQTKKDCKGVYQRTVTTTYEWNEETQKWEPVITRTPWVKVRDLNVNEREALGCYLHTRTSIRVKDECNCWADKVTLVHDRHVNVVTKRPNRTTWVFNVTAKTGYTVHVPGIDGYVKHARLVRHTTNKPCPHIPPHNPAPPHHPCLGGKCN